MNIKICGQLLQSFDYRNNNYNNSFVSFGAMKKSQFSDTDLMVVNKFKAPIEQFNTNQDLQNWCLAKINNDYINKNYTGRHKETTLLRNSAIQEWYSYLNSQKARYNDAVILFILEGITSGLKENNDSLPPPLKKEVLHKTISSIIEVSQVNRNYQTDFNKKYQINLQKSYIQDDEDEKKLYTGWIIIPSKKNNPEKFFSNVKKLQVLSANKWCTKTSNAQPYLSQGDFHIYMENGKAKLGARFFNDTIQEIQGENNNNKIPVKYFNEAKEHAKNYKMHEVLKSEFANTEKLIRRFEDRMGISIENANTEDFLCGARINYTRDNDGLLIINEYHSPDSNFSWDDIGVNENQLFKEIKEITGNADFRNSKVTNLGSLKRIGGSAYFEDASLTSLGNLEEINGDANFRWSKIQNTGKCKINGQIIK